MKRPPENPGDIGIHRRDPLLISEAGHRARSVPSDSGQPPKRVRGTVQIRSGPLEVDDTLLTWEKRLAGEGVDSAAARSS